MRCADVPILLTMLAFDGVGLGFAWKQGFHDRLELALSALPPSLAAIGLFALVLIAPSYWGDRFRSPLNLTIPLLMAGFVFAASSLADTAGMSSLKLSDLERTDLMWNRPLLVLSGLAVSTLMLSGWAAYKTRSLSEPEEESEPENPEC